jgi:hypothetical protein
MFGSFRTMICRFFQITLERGKGNVSHVPVRKAKTSTIVTNKAEAISEEMPKRSPDGVLPIMLQVRQPEGGSHQGYALTGTIDGKIDAIPSPAKRGLLSARSGIGRATVSLESYLPGSPNNQDDGDGVFAAPGKMTEPERALSSLASFRKAQTSSKKRCHADSCDSTM